MLRRIRFKPFFAHNRAVNFLRWNVALFYDSVSDNRCHPSVKEIENPLMDAMQARPEFVDAVRLRPPQFMPQFAQPFHPQKALRLHLYRKFIEPLQERA
jgi:hypothetical protein